MDSYSNRYSIDICNSSSERDRLSPSNYQHKLKKFIDKFMEDD